MFKPNRFYQPAIPSVTEIEFDGGENPRDILFCFDFANFIIPAERMGYEVDFQAISERYPEIKKEVFITQREQLQYGRKLAGYDLHAFPLRNVDIPLALHLNSLKNTQGIKTLILGSGDGGYYFVLTGLKQIGVEIKFLGFEQSFNPLLLELGEFIPIGEDLLKPLTSKPLKRRNING